MKGLDDGPDGLNDAAFERAMRIDQPSRARPTAAQARALRAINAGDHEGLFVARTIRALLSSMWIVEINDGVGYALTPAGRAALARWAP